MNGQGFYATIRYKLRSNLRRRRQTHDIPSSFCDSSTSEFGHRPNERKNDLVVRDYRSIDLRAYVYRV